MTADETVVVVLVRTSGQHLDLTLAQRDRLFERYPELARQAAKWRAITGRAGRVRVIDKTIVEWAVDAFELDSSP